jgi:vitamin B12/bleomycin/antimicrobial peptide transport system ATP-binding/permease protein
MSDYLCTINKNKNGVLCYMSENLQSRPYTPWQLISAYWRSDQKLFAYSFFIFVILMSTALVGMDVVFNYWYNHFYDALQDYDKRGAFDLIAVFMFLAAVYIVLAVYRYYLQAYLTLRWRRWLTDQIMNRWLEKKSYYYLENFDERTDNPDQRIQEDVASLVSGSLDLSIGLLGSITTFVAFIYILWTLSGHFTVDLGSWGKIVVPGYLVWVSIIYSIVGTWLAFKVGFPLVGLNFEQQRREANFRFAAIDLRSHAENVALYRGEVQQRGILGNLFNSVLNNWYAIILRQKLLLWFTAGYNQVSVILPLVVVLPNYFNKVFKLGGLMQALRAFTQIQDALSFFVNSYSTIAQWRATLQRLITFVNHIYEVETKAVTQNKFVYNMQQPDSISTKGLTITTPQSVKLLENINLDFEHGKNYLIKGPSGIGKSTFIRVIAGIWPFGSGEIDLPVDKSIMYLPQKSYMPIGTLRDALMFPSKVTDVTDDDLIKLLKACDLPELVSRLHDVSMWSEQLSPGELQRIAFARVLLHKPHWVFLDESTSALDLPLEKRLFELLKKELPNCSIISIGHQVSVEAFHDQQIDLSRYSVERAPI